MKKLEKSSDGRLLVKKVEPMVSPPQIIPEDFVLVEAYGERCLSGFDDKEIMLNMQLIARHVGPDNKFRKEFDPIIVGSFIPVYRSKKTE